MGRVVVIASVNVDHVVRCVRLPGAGETVLATGTSDGFGGKGANQACAAALAGATVEIVAAVGDDDAGRAALADLRAHGVGCDHVAVVDGPTGRATVVVEDRGENLIVVERGANARLRAEHVATAVQRLELTGADVVLSGGEVDAASAAIAARAAREAGARVVHNLAPFAGVDAWLDDVGPIIVLNAIEAAQACGLDDPRAAATTLGARFGAALVTLGAGGAILAADGRCHEIAAEPVQVVDSTGAGDAVCGTLAAALARGSELIDAAREAVAAASRSVGRAGARQIAK